MMKLAVIEIDELYSPPEGTFFLHIDEWVKNKKYTLELLTLDDVEIFAEKIFDQFKGELKDGELVLGVLNQEKSKDIRINTKKITCMIMFLPNEN